MALYIPRSIFHLARLLYVRPETFGPSLVHSSTRIKLFLTVTFSTTNFHKFWRHWSLSSFNVDTNHALQAQIYCYHKQLGDGTRYGYYWLHAGKPLRRQYLSVAQYIFCHHRNRNFLIVYTGTRHWTLSPAMCIQPTSSHPVWDPF